MPLAWRYFAQNENLRGLLIALYKEGAVYKCYFDFQA